METLFVASAVAALTTPAASYCPTGLGRWSFDGPALQGIPDVLEVV